MANGKIRDEILFVGACKRSTPLPRAGAVEPISNVTARITSCVRSANGPSERRPRTAAFFLFLPITSANYHQLAATTSSRPASCQQHASAKAGRENVKRNGPALLALREGLPRQQQEKCPKRALLKSELGVAPTARAKTLAARCSAASWWPPRISHHGW